jgi:hypothetical protein
VLGIDEVVTERVGFFGGVVECLFCLCAERDLDRRGQLFAARRLRLNLLSDILEREPSAFQNFRGNSSADAHDSQEDVLGLNRRSTQLARLVPGEEQRSPGALGVPLEH